MEHAMTREHGRTRGGKNRDVRLRGESERRTLAEKGKKNSVTQVNCMCCVDVNSLVYLPCRAEAGQIYLKKNKIFIIQQSIKP